jgi:hypothetical protein
MPKKANARGSPELNAKYDKDRGACVCVREGGRIGQSELASGKEKKTCWAYLVGRGEGVELEGRGRRGPRVREGAHHARAP